MYCVQDYSIFNLIPLVYTMSVKPEILELLDIADALDAILETSSTPQLVQLRGEVEQLRQGVPTEAEVRGVRERLFRESASLSSVVPINQPRGNEAPVAHIPEEAIVYQAPPIGPLGSDEDAVASLQAIADWAREAGLETTPWGDCTPQQAIEDSGATSEPAPSESSSSRRGYSPLLLLLLPQGLLFAPYAVPAALGAYAALRLIRGVTPADAMASREQRLTSFIVRVQQICDEQRVPIQIVLTGLCFVGGAVVNVAPGIGQTISPVLLGSGTGGASLLVRSYLSVLDLPRAVTLVRGGDFEGLLGLLIDTYTTLAADPHLAPSWPQYFATVGLGAVAAGAQGSAVIQNVVRVAGAASAAGSLPGLGLPGGTPIQSFVLSFIGGSTNNPLTRKVLEVVIYFLMESMAGRPSPAS